MKKSKKKEYPSYEATINESKDTTVIIHKVPRKSTSSKDFLEGK